MPGRTPELLDCKTSLALAGPFGAGMGRMGEVYDAVTDKRAYGGSAAKQSLDDAPAEIAGGSRHDDG